MNALIARLLRWLLERLPAGRALLADEWPKGMQIERKLQQVSRDIASEHAPRAKLPWAEQTVLKRIATRTATRVEVKSLHRYWRRVRRARQRSTLAGRLAGIYAASEQFHYSIVVAVWIRAVRSISLAKPS